MVDFISASNAVLANSVEETFGFAFFEGWIAGKPVIGRDLPWITCDFKENGVILNHMYEKLSIEASTVENVKERLVQEYFEKVNSTRTGFGFEELSFEEIKKKVLEKKFYRLAGTDCVDFADLNLEMQFEAIDAVNLDNIFKLNPLLEKSLQYSLEAPAGLVGINARAINEKYSLKSKAERTETIIENAWAKMKENISGKEFKEENADNKAMLEKYLSLDWIKLVRT